MTPDFALSLSFDGIRLLHRTPDGWSSLGEVPLDARDLAGDLSGLRRTGLGLDANWIGTKILLPNEQIRYLTLEDPDAGEAEVRAALDGATPYAVSDLVVDHASDSTRTYVAAVARETLEEAEAFAAEHGFQPVSFAADPPEGSFKGEAYFGSTKLAASLLVDGTETRDAPAAALAEPALATPDIHVVNAEPARPPIGDDAVRIVRALSEPPAPSPDPALSIEEPASERVQAEGPIPKTAQALEPIEVPELDHPAPEAVRVNEASPRFSAPTPTAPLSATGVPQPIFASRARPLRGQTREDRAPRLDAPESAGATMPSGRRIEPLLTTGPRRTTAPSAGDWALSAPTPAARKDPPVLPPAATAPSRKEPSVIAAPSRPKVDVAGIAAVASPQATRLESAAAPPATSEAARMTVFGARKSEETPRVGGKPKFLALILTVVLLIVMAAVAVLASVSEQGLARLLRGDTPDITEAPAIASAPEIADAGSDSTPSAVSPDVEPAREVASSAPPAVLPQLDAEDSEAAAAAVAEAIVELRTQSDATDDATPTGALSPGDADRIYAATGVWLRAPRLPLMPDAGDRANEGLPSITSAAAPDARAPDLLAASPDAPLPPPGNSTPAGMSLSPESSGSPAASEDTVLPTGVRVVAGALSLVPPTRPAVPEAMPDSLSDQDAPIWVNAMAEPPAVQPRPRPERPVEPGQALAALSLETETSSPPSERASSPPATETGVSPLATASIALGGVSLDGLRPSARPGDLSPEVPTSEEPATVALAAFEGPRPGLRPEGLAPELPASPDVRDAVAEALAASVPAPEEVAPTGPAAPDIQSTLATIVANAPDPLAGTTARAVAAARVPGTRPGNFDRVVREQLARAARVAQPQQASRQGQRGGVGTGGLQANEQAESSEAEVASSAAAVPSGQTAASVAQAATFADAMALREMNLIGVYGQPGARRALVRLGNGRYLRVGVGDSLDGGQVTAIGENALNYVRRGRTEALVIPGS